MANGFLGDIGDILTGGLQSALDLEIAERLAGFNAPSPTPTAPPPRGGTDRAIATDDGRIIRAGTASFGAQIAAVPPLVWIAAAGVLVVVLVLRR